MTQCEMILEYMETEGSITQLEASAEIGCMRLPARIADLREMGVKIKSNWESKVNRYGRKVNYVRYTLEE